MGQYLRVGNEGFRTIRGETYVDKTGLISFINGTIGTSRKLTCVSRPRRFGKSYAAKMLCAYYDWSCDSRELFEGLEISKSPDFEKYLNRYPVIYIDMTRVLAAVKRDREHRNVIDYLHDKVIADLHEVFPEVEVQDSMQEMMFEIAEATGQKFIVIIDEWDMLFREHKEDKGIQDEYIQLLRALFKDSSWTDRMIAAAYITGILPIKKYGTQSAMNDFREYTMLRPGPLRQYVGFTEEETKALYETSPLDFEEARRWYDGYHLSGQTPIYNPKSVMESITFEEFSSYWSSSEVYESLRVYIDMDYEGLREAILAMVAGKSYPVKTLSFQNDMTTVRSRDDVLTLLVHLGYLTYDSTDRTVSIPNEEVRQEFCVALENSQHSELMEMIRDSDALLHSTLEMEEEEVARYIEKAHMACTSVKSYHREECLRNVVYVAYISCVDQYQLIEELPGGKGYADMVYIPKKASALPALVIELKWNQDEETAISQIRERRYPAVLQGLAGEVLLVGISYDKKTKVHSCQIERWEL